MKSLFEVEYKMVEAKAIVKDREIVRRKLASLKAKYMGTFRQIDVYFDVPRGRLKLREVEGNKKVDLIYYERENVANPKLDTVSILKIQEPASFKTLLKRLLKTSATVEKNREVYQYNGTPLDSKYRHIQIHLDSVKGLGSFVEFELKSSGRNMENEREVLRALMKELEIDSSQLVEGSYADLLKR